MSGWVVVPVTGDRTTPLRRDVLRGGRDHPPLGDGDDPEQVHLAVLEGEDVLSCGTVRPEPHPDGGEDWWRLRGMATDPAHRGRGAGTAVLDALIEHVRRHGGRGLWCNARTGVTGYYERAGFSTEGEPWSDPEIGPHVRMSVCLPLT